MRKIEITNFDMFDRAWFDFEQTYECQKSDIPIDDYMKHLRKAWGIFEHPSGIYIVDEKKYAMFLLRYG